MEFSKVEVKALEQTEGVLAEQGMSELNELHLAMVGGGIGDVVFG